MNYRGTGSITKIILCAALLSGCATKPIITGNGSIYFGIFSSSRTESNDCEYYSIQGVGIGMGRWFMSAGYIESKRLKIDLSAKLICKSEIANVSVGERAEKIAKSNAEIDDLQNQGK